MHRGSGARRAHRADDARRSRGLRKEPACSGGIRQGARTIERTAAAGRGDDHRQQPKRKRCVIMTPSGAARSRQRREKTTDTAIGTTLPCRGSMARYLVAKRPLPPFSWSRCLARQQFRGHRTARAQTEGAARRPPQESSWAGPSRCLSRSPPRLPMLGASVAGKPPPTAIGKRSIRLSPIW